MEIKYKNTTYLLLLISVLVIAACKKDSTASVDTLPVVISYLMPGQPISVKVYQQKSITDTSTYGAVISGLKLNISDGTKTVSLSETTSGNYTYSDNSFLIAGKTYTLQFSYNNLPVAASTLMPAKPTNYTTTATTLNLPASNNYASVVAESFRWDNPDSLYHILVFKNDDNSPYNIHPNMNSAVNFTLNAKQAAGYDVVYRQLNYIGIYRVILYSVNKEYINLLTSNANTSSQQLTNPPTNVTNGYGIFTAMQSDTIKLTLTQY